MNDLFYQDESEAKENLKKAFDEIKWKQSPFLSSSAELDYRGFSSNLFDGYKSEIDDLIRRIEMERKSCEDDLYQYSPAFYDAVKNSQTSAWTSKQYSEQEKTAKKRIEKAVKSIDDYVMRKSRELAKDFFAGTKERSSDITADGLGRPWGAEIRQRLAVAVGLKNEINNLIALGLNSVANSKHVYLGDHFIQLIKHDPVMNEVITKVETKIKRDILSRQNNLSRNVQKIEDIKISGSESGQFGGKRTPGDMLEQLGFTLRHPVASLTKYADTWNVAINELTWSIRSAAIKFIGIYQAVYNIYGFGFVWELEFSIEDSFDLRPSSGKKIDFNASGRNVGYNIITSVMGTAYHDILGNTDKLKVRVKWNNHGQYGPNGIVPWAGLYYR